METSVKVTTSDNKTYTVDTRIAKVSQLFHDILEGGNDTVPLPNVHSTEFLKVLEYCTLHDFAPPAVDKPIRSGTLQDNLREKDYKFISSYTLETIKPLLNASYYLMMNSLRDVCLTVIASEFYIGSSIAYVEAIKKKSFKLLRN